MFLYQEMAADIVVHNKNRKSHNVDSDNRWKLLAANGVLAVCALQKKMDSMAKKRMDCHVIRAPCYLETLLGSRVHMMAHITFPGSLLE